MSYLGDYAEDYADLNFKFTTRRFSTGAPYALSGGTISVYKSNDTAQSTAGVTLTADFDGVTGLNNVKIDLSADAFYAVGKDYQVVITAGTVDSVSVVGECVASFSIENRFQEVDVVKWLGTAAATPTTAGVPEVDVTHWLGTAAATPTVAGVPEVDVTHWIGTAAATPTTAGVPEVDITHVAGAAVNTASAQLGVNVVNAAGTAWGSGAITAAAIATNAIDADAIAADAVTEIQAGLATPTNITAGTITTVTNLTNAPTNGDLTATMKTSVNTEALNALVTHRLDELLNADSDIDGAAPPTVGSVFHELMTKTTGSFTYDQTTDSLEAIKDSGGGGLDAAGVRAAVGLASANLDTQLAAIDDAVDTEVAAIKVVTDKLGTAVELDGAVYRFTANALEQAPAGAAGSIVLGPEYA